MTQVTETRRQHPVLAFCVDAAVLVLVVWLLIPILTDLYAVFRCGIAGFFGSLLCEAP